jgi:hypothetical protein
MPAVSVLAGAPIPPTGRLTATEPTCPPPAAKKQQRQEEQRHRPGHDHPPRRVHPGTTRRILRGQGADQTRPPEAGESECRQQQAPPYRQLGSVGRRPCRDRLSSTTPKKTNATDTSARWPSTKVASPRISDPNPTTRRPLIDYKSSLSSGSAQASTRSFLLSVPTSRKPDVLQWR